jgi:hypothetical protein
VVSFTTITVRNGFTLDQDGKIVNQTTTIPVANMTKGANVNILKTPKSGPQPQLLQTMADLP